MSVSLKQYAVSKEGKCYVYVLLCVCPNACLFVQSGRIRHSERADGANIGEKRIINVSRDEATADAKIRVDGIREQEAGRSRELPLRGTSGHSRGEYVGYEERVHRVEALEYGDQERKVGSVNEIGGQPLVRVEGLVIMTASVALKGVMQDAPNDSVVVNVRIQRLHAMISLRRNDEARVNSVS
ncbi:uncharacterized protein LOC143217516 [Lasioglossum baleicum]|uniref:uncharacterized protein LOC143217516 n=1 Tax=Lasioglossum baleicum TaxID=434251 RepID=UPI003FCC859C